MTAYVIVVPTVWLVLIATIPVIVAYVWAMYKGCRRLERWAKSRGCGAGVKKEGLEEHSVAPDSNPPSTS